VVVVLVVVSLPDVGRFGAHVTSSRGAIEERPCAVRRGAIVSIRTVVVVSRGGGLGAQDPLRGVESQRARGSGIRSGSEADKVHGVGLRSARSCAAS